MCKVTVFEEVKLHGNVFVERVPEVLAVPVLYSSAHEHRYTRVMASD
jgi:hypothetical protein